MAFALTINKAHYCYSDEIEEVKRNILVLTETHYLLIVGHVNETAEHHYHCLLDTPKDLEYLKSLKSFHVEPVRTPQAYIKYMRNHDLVSELEFGDMPYIETDSMIEHCLQFGVVKTVEKFGMKALRNYRALKEFTEDYYVLTQKVAK